MAYEAKTNWKLDDTVMPNDMNRIEQGIKDVESELANASGIIILEASTDNVIDFNTLTEPGVYLIKNCTAGVVNNSPLIISTGYFVDFILNVACITRSDGIGVAQTVFSPGNSTHPLRFRYKSPAGEWESWGGLSASALKAGTLVTGMKCATPTANEELANKGYVDGKTWAASKVTAGILAGQVVANATAVATLYNRQVRNIFVTMTDLTAGTSELATGEIYLVYE